MTGTVGWVNEASAENDDTASNNEDQAVTIDVLGNDTDVEGDELSGSAVT